MDESPKRDTPLPSPLLTVEEAADYLRVDMKTVYRLITDNQLKAFPVGRVYRIERGDLEEFVRRGKLKVSKARKKTY